MHRNRANEAQPVRTLACLRDGSTRVSYGILMASRMAPVVNQSYTHFQLRKTLMSGSNHVNPLRLAWPHVSEPPPFGVPGSDSPQDRKSPATFRNHRSAEELSCFKNS